MQKIRFWLRPACGLLTGALLLAAHPALAQFVQQGGKLVASDAVSNGGQGTSVSLSSDGNTLITGAPAENGSVGGAWIYTRSGTTWSQLGSKLVGTGAAGAAQQGQSVAMSGDGNTALVGGWWDNGFAGATWVFVRSGATWVQQGSKLVGTGAIDIPSQGTAVALSSDGNTAIVGGYSDNNGGGGANYKGAAWIFTRSGTTWTQQAKLTGSDASNKARFGASVSMSADGNTVLVGGYLDDAGANQQGAAWVFTRSGTTWSQQGNKLVGTGGDSFANQGTAVALSADGNTAAVGGGNDASVTGAVWVYTRSGATWTQQGSKLVGTGGLGSSEQGMAVALSADGSTLLSGGITDDAPSQSQAGATWAFTRSAGVWSQFGSKLVGNDFENGAKQGFSVALSANGRTAAVGGPGDHNTIGATWVYAQPSAPTTTTLSSSDNSSVFGQSVTFTATVTAGATGNVAFKRGPVTLGTVALSSGSAEYTTSTLSVGASIIKAVYGGDESHDASTSSGLTQTINKGATTTTFSVSPNPAAAGQAVKITATVDVTSPAAGAPTGTVTFKQGATVLGTATVRAGTAVLSTSGLTIGSHIITAVYGGDTHFTGSSFTDRSLNGTVNVSANVGAQAAANTTTAGPQQLPAIAKLKSGYVIVWASYGQDGSGFGIYGQRFAANGTKAGAELHISTATASNQTMPKVAGLIEGGFVAVWQSDAQDGSQSGIYAQSFNALGARSGPEFSVNTTTIGAQVQPAIAPLSGGGFVIAWTSNGQDTSGAGIYAQRYDGKVKPVGAEFRVNTTVVGAQSAPTIGALTNGGFVVAWQGPDADGLGIYGQRYTSTGATAGTEFRINTATANAQSLPSATGLSDGGFLVAWQSDLQDGSGVGVYAQRYKTLGTKNGAEFRVNTATVGDQWQPQVSGFSDGGFAAVWSSKNQDGSGQGVYAQAYNADGTKANVEFLVNTTTVGNQYQPALAGLATGNFVAAWTGQDAALEGVFTQRLKVPLAP